MPRFPALPALALAALALAGLPACDALFAGRAPGATPCTQGDFRGRPLPLHSIVIDNVNDFNAATEAFPTSTTAADEAYRAYATWDACYLYLGLDATTLGPGACDGAECPPEHRGASPHTYLVYYIDTDPHGSAGSYIPRPLGPAPDRLPFAADYLVEIRTDGTTVETDSGHVFQGNAQLYGRSSEWRIGLDQEWEPLGPSADSGALRIGANSSFHFLEAQIDRAALGDPCAIRILGWVVDTQAEHTLAHWPPPRSQQGAPPSTVEGAPPVLAAAFRTERPDSLQFDYYGFMLTGGQQPNASANLNRIAYDAVADGCTAPDPTEQ